MTLNDKDRAELCLALTELESGRTNRFEDRLWLHFADEWTVVKTHLVKGGFVQYTKDEDNPARLAEPGGALLEQLRESVAA